MSNGIAPWIWRRKRLPLGKEDHPISSLQRQMNRVINDFFSTNSFLPEFFSEPLSQIGEKLNAFTPSVNVAATDKEILVTADLPGMDEKDIEISLTKDSLTIRGERKHTHEGVSQEAWQYIESSYGSFERIVPLNEEVDEEKVDASFSKGILTIKLPRKVSASKATRKVSIRTS